jgi:hypothetical protein
MIAHSATDARQQRVGAAEKYEISQLKNPRLVALLLEEGGLLLSPLYVAAKLSDRGIEFNDI